KLLPAQVESALAAADLETAQAATAELEELARQYGSIALQASAGTARGTFELARGDATAALPVLREAWKLWSSAECPFEAAEARRTLGRACRGLGDEEGARLAITAARAVFEELGAALEARRTADLLGTRSNDSGL